MAQLAREPGRKEARWRDLLQGADGEGHGAESEVAGGADVAAVTPGGDLAARVEALEAEVADLQARLDGLANEVRR